MTRSISILQQLIELDSLKIISFDIFDTLIIRPAINPRDIFYFLDKYYQNSSGKMTKKISKLRIDCEDELIDKKGVEHVTIDLIYERLGDKINLDKEKINGLKEKEISLEVDLAGLNMEMFSILEKAKKIGKKIILTSDMYLTSIHIALILNKFNIEYDALYVSADVKKRKDKGDLYEEIVNRERIQPYEILHIGDNEFSDYFIPLKKGLLAFHYNPHHLATKKNISCKLEPENQGITSIFLGYLFNEENNLMSKKRMKYTNIYDFGYYSIGPFLLSMMLRVLFSGEIQDSYDTLFFSSRDGYLPFKVYELLRNIVGSGIPGRYIYCGRRALSIVHYKGNALDYITDIYKGAKQSNTAYTIEDLFSSLDLENYYIKTNNCADNVGSIKNYITDYNALSLELEKRKNNAVQYFQQIFSGSGRGVIFDCGYSGSVSNFIYKLSNHKIDKIYMWETAQNRTMDKINKTKTNLLFSDLDKITPFHLLFEEVFSPLEPSCLGYENKDGVMSPVFDTSEIFSDKMRCDLTEMHNGVYNYIKRFCSYFTGFISYFGIVDFKIVFDYTMEHLFNEKDESLSLLRNIMFYDRYFEGNVGDSLSNKLCLKNRNNSCKGNILINQEMLYINRQTKLPDDLNFKIGMHLHFFYIELYMEFLEVLMEFPYPFDLFVTCSDSIYAKVISNLFSPEMIPFLKELTVIPVQNKGRDVGPWLIEMKEIHLGYDIFGHFHTKKTVDIGFWWRKYLFDNLLEKNAVIDILNLFYCDNKVGIVYPPMYKDVYYVITTVGDSPFMELDSVRKFVKKINLPDITNCNEIPFSAGTMFWYRPLALSKLFIDGLSYNDFPDEPVGSSGTLAHAIERLPSYIASNAGYDTKLYLNPKILTEQFYTQYQKQKLNNITSFSLSFKKLFLKKLYFKLIKFIPNNYLREKIDQFFREKLFPAIKECKATIFVDKIYKYKEISFSRIKRLKKIVLDHWLGFRPESFIWDSKYVRTGDAWVIDYISKKPYYHVYMNVNNKLYKTDDHLPSPDVAEHFDNICFNRVRFSFLYPIKEMDFGENEFSVLVILNDKKTYYESEIINIYKASDNHVKISVSELS